MCNPCRCCFGKKRRKKKKRKVAIGEGSGPVETSQITMAPEQRSDRIAKNLSNPDKLETADVTEIYQVPSKEFTTVAELIAAQGYQIGDEIGRGQFGVVHQARRLRDAVPMACKVIETQKSDARISAKNELFVLQRLSERGLQHPHIIRLYGHFVVDSPKLRQVYIFMQLAFSKSLSDLTKRFHNGQPEEVCKRIFAQVVSAVAFMHNKGISHRDLKLGNVLVDLIDLSKATCYVSDFGLSRVSRKKDDSIMKSNTAAGTRLYMSPEILMISDYGGDYDPFLADSWAMGVILYRLINREYPFEDTAGMLELQLAHKIKFGTRKQFEPSAELTEMLNKLLDPVTDTRLKVVILAKHSWYASEMAKIEETVPKVKDTKAANAVEDETSESSSSAAKQSSSSAPSTASPQVAKPTGAPKEASTSLATAAKQNNSHSPAPKTSTLKKPNENAKKV